MWKSNVRAASHVGMIDMRSFVKKLIVKILSERLLAMRFSLSESLFNATSSTKTHGK